jgi:hypothetical protein
MSQPTFRCKARILNARDSIERGTAVPAVQANGDIRTLPAYPIPLSQWRLGIAAACHPLTVNLITFFLLSLIIFRRNNDFLFYGDDGKFEVTLIEQFPAFAPPLIGFTADMLRGLGNVFFPVNPYWIPAYFMPLLWQGEYSNFALTYSLCAGEVFVATYLTTRLLQLPLIVGIIAAWLVPLVIMPYFGFGLIPHTAAAFPHYATALAVSTVLASICSIVGDRTLAVNVALSVVLTLGISFITFVAPALLLLGAPIALASAILSCINSATRRGLVVKLFIFGLVGAICLAAYGPFVAGLLFESAASFFKQLSVRAPTLQEISMLFWIPHPFFNIPRLFVAGGLLGAILIAFATNGLARNAAISLLVTEACFLAIGGLQFVHAFWYGPALWYFEGFLFCYLAIFLIAGLFVIGRGITVAFGRLLYPNHRKTLAFPPQRLTGLAIAGLMVMLVLHRGTTDTAGPFFLSYPQAETPITSILKREISLKFDRQFRGRVADFIGGSLPDSNDFQIWHYLRYFSLYETGNTHGAVGLWQDAIPTLTEYNQLITPAYFVFMRHFFTHPNDVQTRNRVEMRHINPRLLAAIGVRFVITDIPGDGELRLRSKLLVHAPEHRRETFGAPLMFRDHKFFLHLYEVPGTNVGQYSPTLLRRADNAASVLKALDSPDLDLALTVVTSEALPEGLVPAQLQEFSIGRGNVHVRATSLGRSMLLLPLEFSHCLTLSAATGKDATSNARLLRADLVLTGLVFERAVDANIRYFTGPFANSTCRLKDRTESIEMDIANVFRDQPEFFPNLVVR